MSIYRHDPCRNDWSIIYYYRSYASLALNISHRKKEFNPVLLKADLITIDMAFKNDIVDFYACAEDYWTATDGN